MPRGQKRKISRASIKKISKKILRVFTKTPKRAPAKKTSKTASKIVKKVRAKIKAIRKIQLPIKFSDVPFENNIKTEPSSPQDLRIPSHYGETKLVLLVRDPWWLYSYWEIEKHRQDELSRELDRRRMGSRKTVLRVYDVTGGALPAFNSFFDIELNFYTDNWYIDVGMPGKEWIAEIGYRTEDGSFFALVRSNAVRTPAFGLSDVSDEEWMLPEDIYLKIIGHALGAASASSLDIRKLLEKYLRSIVSSEQVSLTRMNQAVPAAD